MDEGRGALQRPFFFRQAACQRAVHAFPTLIAVRMPCMIAGGVGRQGQPARVRLEDRSIHLAEVHWYEASGIGQFEFKIKQFF